MIIRVTSFSGAVGLCSILAKQNPADLRENAWAMS